MKIKRIFTALLAMSLLLMNQHAACAQGTNKNYANELTNDVLTLGQMMASNNIVTNTVGMVLVKISSGLWAGKFVVTQDSYQKVMNSNPSAFSGNDRPVDSVTWNDAMAFCEKLTRKEKMSRDLAPGYAYSLPTQAQWENLASGTSLDDAVTSLPPSHHSSTEPVGSLGANSLGLYDMRGNVMEWCLDPQDQPYRVLRGGAWDTFVEPNTRIEFRNYSPPDQTKNDYGFRVVLQGTGPLTEQN
jgi:formylglycine-generating enzyme required for sulfatase activity